MWYPGRETIPLTYVPNLVIFLSIMVEYYSILICQMTDFHNMVTLIHINYIYIYSMLTGSIEDLRFVYEDVI